jgi:hypothetical protein
LSAAKSPDIGLQAACCSYVALLLRKRGALDGGAATHHYLHCHMNLPNVSDTFPTKIGKDRSCEGIEFSCVVNEMPIRFTLSECVLEIEPLMQSGS